MARQNLRVTTQRLEKSNLKVIDLEPHMGVEVHLPNGSSLVIDVSLNQYDSAGAMIGLRAREGQIFIRPVASNVIRVGVTAPWEE